MNLESAILELLRRKPMRTADIVSWVDASIGKVREVLWRMECGGIVERGEREWFVVSPAKASRLNYTPRALPQDFTSITGD